MSTPVMAGVTASAAPTRGPRGQIGRVRPAGIGPSHQPPRASSLLTRRYSSRIRGSEAKLAGQGSIREDDGATDVRRVLSVAVLGLLEVMVAGRLVVFTAGRLQTLLAVLAMSAGETVSLDYLAAAVWEGSLPADVRKTVQTYVTRLRAVLGAELITYVCTVLRTSAGRPPSHTAAAR